MRIPQSYIQKCKVVGHFFQGIFIFVGLCVTIAVFTKEGETGGATKYYLALVSPSASSMLLLHVPSLEVTTGSNDILKDKANTPHSASSPSPP